MKCWILWMMVLLGEWPQSLAAQGFPVVISEIMGDPMPSVALPAEEFVELTNVSDDTIDLSGWTISNQRTNGRIPAGVRLEPGGILILCANRAVPLFQSFGYTAGLSSFPAISNNGDTIMLYDADRVLVHAVDYRPALLNKNYEGGAGGTVAGNGGTGGGGTGSNGAIDKNEGGWSLELVDLSKACRSARNWRASRDPSGGTPGRINSWRPQDLDDPFENGADNYFLDGPELLHAWSSDGKQIRLVFTDAVNVEDAARMESYQLPDGFSIRRVEILPPFWSEVDLELTPSLEQGKVYRVAAPGIGNCYSASGSGGSRREVSVGIADESDHTALTGLRINELLFDPPPEGSDFVELINADASIINLSGLQVASRNRSREITGARFIIAAPRFLYPGEYLVLTTDADWLMRSYHVKDPATIVELPSLPSWPNGSGTVVLFKRTAAGSEEIIVDELAYTSDWHHPLVRNKEGVSLERIDPDGPVDSPDNWSSAATHAGYATPGYKNSQSITALDRNRVFLDQNWFSPDGDGFYDDCILRYQFDKPGYLASINIYNRHGFFIKRLHTNAICAASGFFQWDGRGARADPLPDGLYILVVDVWHPSGKTKRYRQAVTLYRKK